MSEKYKVRDQDSPYFITFAVVEWVDVFTRQLYRDILLDSLRYCQKEKGLVVYAWCLMSNHIHMIVGRSAENKIEEIIRDFKKFTSVHICRAIEQNERESRRSWMLDIFRREANDSRKHEKYKFWQNEYHAVELFYNEMIDQKLDYVHNNPVEAGIVENAEDYLYSSARNYAGLNGLIEVEFAL
ncbi:transposase [Fulvivirgaceae bacterium PWU4]|uniref:Transposase n=1 Tax=Chryseosolibacter histidini TaxID=2782349 RepID=A0AAP2GS30_9BACT|nr:transposase [Chryseosolibacter histidini]MBT1700690.1 transposase [Chryseosolibacter histidini]